LIERAGAGGGTSAPQRLATAVGQQQVVHLADGTQVVLGPGSTLDVPAGYGGTARRVRLTGEAYFRAVHDARRPFEVAAGDALIRDLGTAFVVRAAGTPGQPVDVAVTTGTVQLRATADSAAPGPQHAGVLLRAGDRGRVLAATGAGAPSTVAVVARGADVASDTAWTTGHLVFRDAPLGEVAGALRRWYGLDLRFDDPAAADRHLTATFSGESTAAVLHVIGLATGVRLERRGDTVVVREAAPSH
ncbi:MAG TPA: FecR domain-containing protein, partial [Gemmatirosa sp.]